MRGLARPDEATWRTRNDWFWRAHDVNAGPQALDLDARADALLAELELLFCVGAWASVIMVAWTLVESVERKTGRDDTPAPDIDWLRERRNALVHVSSSSSEPIDDAALETAAQGAVRIVFKSLFAHAWTAAR